MKLLISAEGAMLNSRVSKRFSHAQQYLIVETESLDFQPLSLPSHMSKHEVISKAVPEGVVGVITGHVGPHVFATLAARNLFAVLVHNATVAEAVERFNRNELKILSAPALHATPDEYHQPAVFQRQTVRSKDMLHINTAGYAAGTSRGRHHLQQFAGRGH
jgi:predicted Fe-Mo cluster-binding NifX family protein